MYDAEHNDQRPAPEPSRPLSLLRKILVTLTIGGPTYWLTNVLIDDKLVSVALSIFLGGITLVVQFLLELESRLSGVVREVRSALHRVNHANRLFDRLEASPIKGDVLELADRATRIRPEGSGLAVLVAQEEIKRASRFLKDVGARTAVSYVGEDRDWLLTLVDNVANRIDATSSKAVDNSFWKSDLGQRYLYAQVQAIGRGVAIRRIFLLDTRAGSHDTEFHIVCRLQRQVGIDIRIMYANELPAPLIPKLLDFVLFDEVLSYENTPAPRIDKLTRPEISESRLQLDPGVVRERVSRYQALWEAAVPYQPLD